MFKRENRLVSKGRLTGFKNIAFPQFILKVKKNELDTNRFRIVVSKKIDKRAVGRNRIKRFFRTILVDLNKKMNKGNDLLFIVKTEILEKNKEENVSAVRGAITKANLIEK